MSEPVVPPAVSPSTSEKKWDDRRIDAIMGLLLRAGVILSATVVLIGAVVFLVRHGWEPTDDSRFHGEPTVLKNPIDIVQGAFTLQGEALIQLGILLLIATPVARVAFSVYAFARQRDGFYVLATLLVLSILLYGLFA